MIKRSRTKSRTKSTNKNGNNLDAAKLFNSAVTKAITKYKLTPSSSQLYKLCDALRKEGHDFAALIIEAAIANSANVTNSAYILGGLQCLLLYKCELLPTPSQVREADKKYHGRKQ